MTKNRFILSFAVVVLCLMATPVMADIWGFHFGSLESAFTPGASPYDFTMSVIPTRTVGSVDDDSGVGIFIPPWTSGGFSLSMAISSVTPDAAHGVGTFTITDADASNPDTITGSLAGDWTRNAAHTSMSFIADLSNVRFTDNGTQDRQFNGNAGGFIAMDPAVVGEGAINAGPLSTTKWFDSVTTWTVKTGSVDGVDAPVVPVPAAVLLGVLGLGAAGLKLRKFV